MMPSTQTTIATTNADAFSRLREEAATAGLALGTLSDAAAVALSVAHLLRQRRTEVSHG